MATLDLKPLTKETIHKMGYTNHDLWVIKINEDVFGPFEVQSLKHYASENEILFIPALASRLDQNDWLPFYSYAIFSEAKNNDDKNKTHMSSEGPYWILVEGQKIGPLPKMAIEKKIEMGILANTELISYDDGHTWQKVYQIESLGQKVLQEDLPAIPDENSFQRAKEELLEKINSKSSDDDITEQQSIATLAFLGSKKESTRLVNLEEIDVKSVGESDVSKSLKWALPICVSFVATLAVIGYFIFKTPNTPEMAQEDETRFRKVAQKKIQTEASFNELPAQPVIRPAAPSNQQYYDRSSLTRPSRIRRPTYPDAEINTHETARYPEHEEAPVEEAMAENIQDEETEEHNLIKKIERRPSSTETNPENQEGLDESMSEATNNAMEEQPEAPVMEEASDF